MSRFAYRSLIYKQFLLLALWCWVCALTGANKSFASTSSSSDSDQAVSSSPPNNAAEAVQYSSNHVSATKPSPKPLNTVESEEGFPVWIVVLIIVISGLFIVACCLGMVRLYRWKNDQGTYSMWNEQEPNVESLYARESRVLFEKLDIEASLSEDQCYEIPVDSLVTPQRVYIGGTRVELVKEGLEDSIGSMEKRVSESSDKRTVSVHERTSRGSDITSRTESTHNSMYGDTSRHSSESQSTASLSDRVASSGVESPSKASYIKPLPVLPVITSNEPVTCETYKLNGLDQQRVNALVNRPLPQTPLLSRPFNVVGSSASLDRSLLQQLKVEKLEKPNVMFRTLPRPKKIRQLHLPRPLFSAMTKSSSTVDVNKETRLQDHVACDPNECTLTRVKKRMSQSLDTLVASQRVSHFYENPYLMSDDESQEQQVTGGHQGTLGAPVDPPYASVSSLTGSKENLPRGKEHLYARISTYINNHDGHSSDGNLNRHSYASIHYRARPPSPIFHRPKSRHTYISIIFGSADSVSGSPASEHATNSEEISKSRSCSDLTSLRRSLTPGSDDFARANGHLKNSYVNVAEVTNGGEDFPRIHFCPPRNSRRRHETQLNPTEGIPNGSFQKQITQSDNLMSFPESKDGYVNVNEELNAFPAQNLPHGSSTPIYQNLRNVTERSYYENANIVNQDSSYLASNGSAPSTMEDSGHGYSMSSSRNSESSHYGVPKSPAIPLKRFQEILGEPSLRSKGSVEDHSKYNGLGLNGLDESPKRKTLSTYLEGRLVKELELHGGVSDTEAKARVVSGESESSTRQTLSTYLEDRFVKGLELHGDTGSSESSPKTEDPARKDTSDEHFYENYVQGKPPSQDCWRPEQNGDIEIVNKTVALVSGNRDSSTSEESASSHDKLSSASSLSIDEKENFENQPLIPRTAPADVNGNSVCGGYTDKLNLTRNSISGNALSGESLA